MQPSILIAGVGNIFHGDDAFGSEVAHCLAQTPLPPEVRVIDFGIRGHDLAFALQDDYEAVLMIDVAQRSQPPGALTVIEPELQRLGDASQGDGIDTHVMHPMRILQVLQAQGSKVPPIWFVVCEPSTFGPEEGYIGLSDSVGAAVPKAVALVHSLLKRLVPHE